MITTPNPEYELEIRLDIKVPMRDGIKLSTDLYLPKGNGPFPVVITRTPYGNNDEMRAERLLYMARRGFACAFQDCRGRFDSDGEWEPFRTERHDGFDTIQWLSEQKFCNGSVGVTGRSYEGYNAWIVAPNHHPALKAIIPIVPLPDPVINVPYQNGALFWNMIVWGFFVHSRTNQNTALINWPALYKHVPLRTLDKAAGIDSKTWQNWLKHPTFDDWWKEVCYMHQWGKVDIPVMHICGWYDDDGISTYKNFPGMRKYAPDQKTKDDQMLVIGCWPHKTNVSSVVGEMDFGPQALIDLNGIMFRFFAKHLAGEDHYKKNEPGCRIFIMGENRWHGFDDWPIPGSKKTKFYLKSDGNANSLFGDGLLTREKPAENQPPDKYTYDPDNPVPYITDPVELQLGEASNQQSIERRPDVLVYTSAPLENDMVICGRVFAEIYISTDVEATDFTGKLVDVHPNGMAIQLCDGIQRAEYRNSLEKAEWLKKDEIYKVTIDMWATGIRFSKGHSIRLEISSGAVPKFTRHMNTSNDPADEINPVIANQIVYHDADHPSALIVDIIPGEVLLKSAME
ncbi:CocE/NonD family hydrolase [bacterium]|nr:CocE/NonD family hydrolase [bacterium]MBU1024815.1 CocE/NonD family hydrolase [bacterium]